MTQDFTQLFGPSGRGEYAPGDQITFLENKNTLTGEVIHCSQPQTLASGRRLPLSYQVDCDDGMPHVVTSDQIVQR
jgi:hypothetical protein